MYTGLLSIHSIFRWLVLLSLLYSIYRAYKGWLLKTTFTNTDNVVRFTTAIIAHVQLIIGLWLYFISPIVQYFLNNFNNAKHINDMRFFGMEHSLLMLIAVVIITIGSSRAKKEKTDHEKFKVMAIWFSIALLIILIAILWPFLSFTANRPYFR